MVEGTTMQNVEGWIAAVFGLHAVLLAASAYGAWKSNPTARKASLRVATIFGIVAVLLFLQYETSSWSDN